MKDWINRTARRIPNWLVYLVLFLPAPWLFYLGLTGGLGREPINALEREYGELALQLLIASLCITPLRNVFGINLIKFRRVVGLMAFAYVAMHLCVWLFLDVQIVSQIVKDILKRPYVTVGMAAFLLMIPLAVTSNNWSIRRLGPGWQKLHRLTYVAAILGGVHFIWLSRGFQLEPILYTAAIVGLVSMRIIRRARRTAR